MNESDDVNNADNKAKACSQDDYLRQKMASNKDLNSLQDTAVTVVAMADTNNNEE